MSAPRDMTIGAPEIIRAGTKRAVLSAIIALLSFTSIFAAFSVLYAGWLQPLRGGALLTTALFIVDSLSIVAAGTVAFWVWARLGLPPAPAPLVLWLRRFHQTGPGRTPPHRILLKACGSLGVPVTVRDTRVPASFIMAVGRLILAAPLLVVALDLFWVSSMSLVAYWFRKVPGGPLLAMVLGTAATAAVGWAAYGLLVKSSGVIALGGADASARTGKLLDGIQQRPHSYPGLVVIKTTDEHWTDVLTLAIQRASAVLIDVSEISSNVEWEIRTALELHPSERLILAKGVDTYRTNERLDDNPSGTAWLRDLNLGDRLLPVIRGFTYPVYRDHRGRPSPETLATRKLRNLLAASLANAGSSVEWSCSVAAFVSLAALILGAISIAVWKIRPQPPNTAEVRQVVLTAAGAPPEMIDSSTSPSARAPLPQAPSEPLVYSLRYVNKLEASRRYDDAVTESSLTYGEQQNPWQLLALNRAHLLARDLDCTNPAVVSLSGSSWAVNRESVDKDEVLGHLLFVTKGYGVVFIVPATGANPEQVLTILEKIANPHFDIVLAGSLNEIAQHCGTKASELVRRSVPSSNPPQTALPSIR
jgi:hypothetical protein